MEAKTVSRIEYNERELRRKKAKAIAIMALLITATVGCLSVLWLWERTLFNAIAYGFAAVGFVRVMMVFVTWIDELTIEQPAPTVEDWAEYRGSGK